MVAQIVHTLIQPRITSPYGYRIDPITGEENQFHPGIDLAVKDEVLYAPENGTLSAGYDDLNGTYVIITHSGFKSAYCHLQLVTHPGGAIKEGEPFGISGSTGRSTGAHLHFGLRTLGGSPIDPTDYFRKMWLISSTISIGVITLLLGGFLWLLVQ